MANCDVVILVVAGFPADEDDGGPLDPNRGILDAGLFGVADAWGGAETFS